MQVIIKKFLVFQFIAAIAVGCYGSKKSIKIIHANDLYKKVSLINEAAAIRFVQSEIIALGTMKINRQH